MIVIKIEINASTFKQLLIRMALKGTRFAVYLLPYVSFKV